MASRISRNHMLRTTAGAAIAAAASSAGLPLVADAATLANATLFRALDTKIVAAMARYHIPGVAVAVLYKDTEYVRGYGVTNVNHPRPVDGDTLFRIGSITKTFTGTAIMRLVDSGKVRLDAPVRTYLPGLILANQQVAETVTFRQILNHSAGWLGDDYAGSSRGEDALPKYVAGMRYLPQLTPPGQVFAYNNAAVNLAGRLIEVATGMPYEDAMQKLLLEALGLKRSGFFTDTLVGNSFSASHTIEKDNIDVDVPSWLFPRALDSTGGLISNARDQLRYAQFHLGNGTAYNGARVLTPQSLLAMRSNPGPAGTVTMEIDGVCVTFWQRRTAQGVPVFQHSGSWGGQNADLVIVPKHKFAMSILTNSTTGGKLIAEVSSSAWALNHFVGLSNPRAVPKKLPRAELAAYEGNYKGGVIPPGGSPNKIEPLAIDVRAADGGLHVTGDLDLSLGFYRDDYVLTTTPDGGVARSDFIRGPGGTIAWYRDRGRLYKRQS